MRSAIERGERMLVPALVRYEWLRGPRLPQELTARETLFPSESAIPFGPVEAARAAMLYRALKRPHGREIDLAIAACALTREASVWTLIRWHPRSASRWIIWQPAVVVTVYRTTKIEKYWRSE